MPNLGTWRSPFPLRLGGNAERVVSALYDAVRASRPTMLRGGEGDTQVEQENKALARMAACGWRATQRRLTVRDPHKLSALKRPVTLPGASAPVLLSVLDRWESLLGLLLDGAQTDRSRREACAAHLATAGSNAQRAVRDAMATLFGSWFVSLSEHRASEVDYPGRSPAGEVHAEWGGAGFAHGADYPGDDGGDWLWRSAVAEIAVVVQPPASAPQREVDALVSRASALLDDLLPAWMDFHVSQLTPDQPGEGFYADISLVGLTAV
jgi:hypothetical protein